MGMDSGNNIVIEVQDMQYAYPDGTLALKGISLKIGRGEFIAFLGQNGAGKTTFAKTLNGLLKVLPICRQERIKKPCRLFWMPKKSIRPTGLY